MNKCDIIIPIYNAYECTEACIKSVIKNTNLKENGLILINDKSPDERISKLLSKYKNNNSITILENENNLGFVGTVNRGMKLSKNDVLLLNSDTEVTENWLDKIKKCAYHDDMIATVTPLSNNATLASVPISFEPNDLPKNVTLEEMGKLVENCSYHDYPEIPTGHGFCLYIKREALNKVGYFDEEGFGKGYGEENDFCYRCLNYGYRHILCDDTYIYHKESQSFREDKKDLIADGLRILNERYPQYINRLNQWIAARPLKYIGENIALELGKIENRPNILYIIHDWKDIKNHNGGTTLHALDLIQNMRNKFNFHVFAPEDGIYKLYSYYKNTETEICFPGVIKFHDLGFYNSDYKKTLENIIDTFNIDLIHIHHTKDHYFDIANIIKERKIYTILTLHDYYSVCPMINKIYKNKEYCGIPTENMCNECLKCMLNNNLDIISWRDNWKKLLNSVNKIITPSEAAKEEIEKTYSDVNIDVIEHGIDIVKDKSELSIEGSTDFNVAFIGAIGIHKGSKILEELRKSKKLKNIKIHLFGILDSVDQKSTNHFINHGKYKREELKELLKKNNIKLICLFSTWPETYSYTMTESIASGIPVLSFDIGAINERIKKYKLGWTIRRNSSTDDIIKKLLEISSNQKDYKKVINNINKYTIKTTKEMANEYVKIYNKNKKLNNKINDSAKEMIKNSKLNNPIVVYNNYAWVFDTLKWKIISKIKIPGSAKKILKKVLTK